MAKNKMYKSVMGFLKANAAVFAGFARLVKEIENFVALNGMLDGFIMQQGMVIKGIAAGKQSAFEGLVKNVVTAARKALVYAKDIADNAMQATLDVRADTFNIDKTDAFVRVQNIYGILEANAEALVDYMVVAADIEAIGSGITAYRGLQAAPANAKSARVGARKEIVLTMGKIDESIAIIDDLLVNTYGESNGEMVAAYVSNRAINDSDMRHGGIRAMLKDAGTGAPLEGAVVAIAALKKRGVANINGLARIIKMKGGTYHVSFSAEGYVGQTMTLVIERGKVLKMEVGMVR